MLTARDKRSESVQSHTEFKQTKVKKETWLMFHGNSLKVSCSSIRR